MITDPATNKLIKDRLDQLPTEIHDLINSTEIDDAVRSLTSDLSLSPEQASKLSNEITLTILFFAPVTNLEERIKTHLNVDKETADKLYTYIYYKIFFVREHIFSLASDVADVESTDQSAQKTTPATHAQKSNTESVRTMADDIAELEKAEEQIYSSSQDTLLQQNQPPQNIPTPSNPPTPPNNQ